MDKIKLIKLFALLASIATSIGMALAGDYVNAFGIAAAALSSSNLKAAHVAGDERVGHPAEIGIESERSIDSTGKGG